MCNPLVPESNGKHFENDTSRISIHLNRANTAIYLRTSYNGGFVLKNACKQGILEESALLCGFSKQPRGGGYAAFVSINQLLYLSFGLL